MKPLATPDLTAAQLVAGLATAGAQFVAYGLLDAQLEQLLVSVAGIVVPVAWILADAIIRHGRAKYAAALAARTPPVA